LRGLDDLVTIDCQVNEAPHYSYGSAWPTESTHVSLTCPIKGLCISFV
jgi:hypothetical protein